MRISPDGSKSLAFDQPPPSTTHPPPPPSNRNRFQSTTHSPRAPLLDFSHHWSSGLDGQYRIFASFREPVPSHPPGFGLPSPCTPAPFLSVPPRNMAITQYWSFSHDSVRMVSTWFRPGKPYSDSNSWSSGHKLAPRPAASKGNPPFTPNYGALPSLFFLEVSGVFSHVRSRIWGQSTSPTTGTSRFLSCTPVELFCRFLKPSPPSWVIRPCPSRMWSTFYSSTLFFRAIQ